MAIATPSAASSGLGAVARPRSCFTTVSYTHLDVYKRQGLYFIGAMPLGNKRALDFGIYLIMLISACWYYRKTVGYGYMHFWEGLTIGYVVNSVGAFVSGWLVYLSITWIDPSVFTGYLADMKQLLMQGKPCLLYTSRCV